MQKKGTFPLALGAVVLFVLMILFTHGHKEVVETQQSALMNFAALVPADGVVELNKDAPPPGKQFVGEDAVAVVLFVQEAGLVPYSGPKHTPAPGYSWSIRCRDGMGNDLFVLYLDGNELEYYNSTDERDAVYYSLSQEDMDALHTKLEQFFKS